MKFQSMLGVLMLALALPALSQNGSGASTGAAKSGMGSDIGKTGTSSSAARQMNNHEAPKHIRAGGSPDASVREINQRKEKKSP